MTTAAAARHKELLAMTQKEMLAQIRERAKLGNLYCYHTWNSKHSEPGMLDVILLDERRLIFAELLMQHQHLSKEQAVVFFLLKRIARNNPGLEVCVVRPLSLEWFLTEMMA